MKLKNLAWMVGLCAALAATSAYSQQRKAGDVYLGAALGYVLAPDAEDEMQAAADQAFGTGAVSVSVDDGVFGWNAYGGWFLSDAVAVEVGYLGGADTEVTLRQAGGGESATGDLSTTAFYGAAVAHLPMSDGASVSPFVKAGMARWESEFSLNLPSGRLSSDDDGTDFLVGGGVDVAMNETISVRGEWMMLMFDDEAGGAQHRFQVGLNIAF